MGGGKRSGAREDIRPSFFISPRDSRVLRVGLVGRGQGRQALHAHASGIQKQIRAHFDARGAIPILA